eukprot:TRINITY_DN1325_c0_g1_i1.p1 TRINITY_DN1325_c0_g1~~TRINITY_DN1325_c0_g1_i1.p1  ORF type:complete len:306 (-),score=63.63 TRINITY_DN1325_c0_g1_i1:87-1004(-)
MPMDSNRHIQGENCSSELGPLASDDIQVEENAVTSNSNVEGHTSAAVADTPAVVGESSEHGCSSSSISSSTMEASWGNQYGEKIFASYNDSTSAVAWKEIVVVAPYGDEQIENALTEQEFWYPSYFPRDDPPDQITARLVHRTTRTFKYVQKLFQSVWKGKIIVKIEHVVNRNLWRNFCKRRDYIANVSNVGGNIRFLWHQTTSDEADTVSIDGFGICDTDNYHGAVSRCIHFETDPTKSGKMHLDTSGQQKVFLARAALGEVHISKLPMMEISGFCSFACEENPSSYCFTDPLRAYPEFIVTYT